MITWGQLKTDIRLRLFPSGEADNLVASHDKDFIDAIVDLQRNVPCLQQDNTDIYPQCATTYNCGLTVLPCPRGYVKKLSVMDKIDPTTHRESADAADDYCSQIAYPEVDYCHVRRYLETGMQNSRCCFPPMGLFFGLPFCGHRPAYPTPTDVGVPAGLKPLPMGFHYPQTSTDRTYGRAGAGVWAKDRGNIYVAPWIQSTETIILVWDGVKRTWQNGDPVDDDPLLSKAIEEYVRWQHAAKWDKDEAAAANAMTEYNARRAELMKDCRDETRVRSCEPSVARASSVGMATLFYNDAQSATASCPDGQTGTPVSVTIPAGTVGSTISVSDANTKAKAQATSQAQAQLVCTATPVTYWNTVAGQYTASCAVDGTLETGAPEPTGSPVTVTVPIGTVSSAVSVAAANAAAQAQAQEQAIAQLSCTYANAPQTASKSCPDGTNEVTATVAAGTYTADSQSAADQLAMAEAQNEATSAFEGTDCGGGGGGATTVWNTATQANSRYQCSVQGVPSPLFATIVVIMPAHTVSDTTQLLANQKAQALAQQWADLIANNRRIKGYCVGYQVTYPNQ